MKAMCLKVPDPLYARLTAAARQRRTSKSALVREALDQWAQQPAVQKTPTCLDLARDLMGCVKSGPRDLSYNKEHMKGFGS